MTILKARKKLGKKAEKYTDDQIQKMISMLTIMCNKAIGSALETKEKRIPLEKLFSHER